MESMDTRLFFQDADAFGTPMLAVFAVDVATGKDDDPLPALLTTSDAITRAAERLLSSGEFKAAAGEVLLLHAPNGIKAERLLLIGLGKAKALSIDEIRRGGGTAVRNAKPRGFRDITVAFPEDHALSDEHLEDLPCALIARALVEGAVLAEPDYDTYKTDRTDRSLHTVTIVARETEKATMVDTTSGFGRGPDRRRCSELCSRSRQRARQRSYPDGTRKTHRRNVCRSRPRV